MDGKPAFKAPDIPDVVCYNCGKKGHTRPNCPSSKSVRVKAVRIEEVPDEDDPLSVERNDALGESHSHAGDFIKESTQEVDCVDDPVDYSVDPGDQWVENQNYSGDEYEFDPESESLAEDEQPVRSNAVRILHPDELDQLVRLSAVKVEEDTNPPMIYHHRMRRKRPDRKQSEVDTLTGYFRVNGTLAHILFDSASEGVMMSPSFARVTKTKVFELEEPVHLQLATVGSRSKFSYGAEAQLEFAPDYSVKEWVDIVNIDAYDINNTLTIGRLQSLKPFH
jgi:hypothetical protein